MATKPGLTDNKANNYLWSQLAFTDATTQITNYLAGTIAAGQLIMFVTHDLPLISTKNSRFILGIVHYITHKMSHISHSSNDDHRVNNFFTATVYKVS